MTQGSKHPSHCLILPSLPLPLNPRLVNEIFSRRMGSHRYWTLDLRESSITARESFFIAEESIITGQSSENHLTLNGNPSSFPDIHLPVTNDRDVRYLLQDERDDRHPSSRELLSKLLAIISLFLECPYRHRDGRNASKNNS